MSASMGTLLPAHCPFTSRTDLVIRKDLVTGAGSRGFPALPFHQQNRPQSDAVHALSKGVYSLAKIPISNRCAMGFSS